ncbi:MAG: DUF2949 domain-containing protein [Cyanophyceae cyanobacterium]
MSSEVITLIKDFLRTELRLSHAAIDIALNQWKREQGPLPVILWRYGLITIEQLAVVFDWLDNLAETREWKSI